MADGLGTVAVARRAHGVLGGGDDLVHGVGRSGHLLAESVEVPARGGQLGIPTTTLRKTTVSVSRRPISRCTDGRILPSAQGVPVSRRPVRRRPVSAVAVVIAGAASAVRWGWPRGEDRAPLQGVLAYAAGTLAP